MNGNEIRQALKLIKEPITVNCIEYKYFTQENYNKLIKVYENCLWFADNLEQIISTTENLEKENKQLEEDLEKEKYLVDKLTRQLTDEYRNTEYQTNEKVKKDKIIKDASDYLEYYLIGNNKFKDSQEQFNKLLNILDIDKGE